MYNFKYISMSCTSSGTFFKISEVSPRREHASNVGYTLLPFERAPPSSDLRVKRGLDLKIKTSFNIDNIENNIENNIK